MFVTPPAAVGEKCGLQPAHSGFSHADWHCLASFWHPVAFSQEVADRPFAASLLDVDLVLYRHAAGVTVALDRCANRSVPLSRGSLKAQTLACSMHGLRFDGTGRYVAIPSAGEGMRMPDRLRLRTFPSLERYGIVWTCLSGEPRWPLPEWPAFEVPGRAFYTASDTWQASALRHVENFNDIAHFAWAHAGTFGARERPRLLPEVLEESPAGLRRTTRVAQVERDTFTDEALVAEADYVYEFTFPFASSLRIAYPNLGHEWIYDAVCPLAPERSRIFILKARDYGQDQPLADWVAFQDAVNEEDRLVVEGQRPRAVPMEAQAEAHIAADAWSLAFRRRWRRYGLTRTI